MKICKVCDSEFEITTKDQEFYRKIIVPEPTLCPKCRYFRRCGTVNDYVLYARKCDQCQKSLISVFPPKSEYNIICQNCWFSEERKDKLSGQSYDPKLSFFEQFDKLMHESVQMGIMGMMNKNSDYCESVANCKNCYLISESSNCEDCLYCYWIQKTVNTLDSNYTHECERCYELENCFNCYNLKYSQNCLNCSDSYFLDNCIGSKNCMFCTNLRHKEYFIKNKGYSKEEYHKKIAELDFRKWELMESTKEKFQTWLTTQPRKHHQFENVENCSGDYIKNAKNCTRVFHCYDAEECAYGEHIWRGAKYCYDSNTAGRDAELLYETTNSGIESYNVKFSRYCWGSKNAEYCNNCFRCSDIFGCVSLKPNARYCILNKQYTKDDYEKLKQQVISDMKSNHEYGEFFPLSISLFGYNNTIAFDETPVSKQEALQRGYKWEEQSNGIYGKAHQEGVLACTKCSKNYKIIPQERKFYDSEDIPTPKKCPDCRLRERLDIHGKKNLKEFNCSTCGIIIQTSLDTKKYQQIYCDECYNKLVY